MHCCDPCLTSSLWGHCVPLHFPSVHLAAMTSKPPRMPTEVWHLIHWPQLGFENSSNKHLAPQPSSVGMIRILFLHSQGERVQGIVNVVFYILPSESFSRCLTSSVVHVTWKGCPWWRCKRQILSLPVRIPSPFVLVILVFLQKFIFHIFLLLYWLILII